MDQHINYGGIPLKLVVCVQIVFCTWGYISVPGSGDGFLTSTYSFQNILLILFGALAIGKPKSPDLVLMYLFVNIFTILNDILLLSLHQPFADAAYEQAGLPHTLRNTYRFALGMSIVNLILKPVICFLLYRIYQARGGNINEELSSVTVSGRGAYQGYDQIDDNSTSTVETASPHRRLDSQK